MKSPPRKTRGVRRNLFTPPSGRFFQLDFKERGGAGSPFHFNLILQPFNPSRGQPLVRVCSPPPGVDRFGVTKRLEFL
ncbi:hypothetical protein BGS_0471 [Beggiatoa sp. SS]|nr:hypothetical protein BGS_0471 [Beggiatoa sp. SS]